MRASTRPPPGYYGQQPGYYAQQPAQTQMLPQFQVNGGLEVPDHPPGMKYVKTDPFGSFEVTTPDGNSLGKIKVRSTRSSARAFRARVRLMLAAGGCLCGMWSPTLAGWARRGRRAGRQEGGRAGGMGQEGRSAGAGIPPAARCLPRAPCNARRLRGLPHAVALPRCIRLTRLGAAHLRVFSLPPARLLCRPGQDTAAAPGAASHHHSVWRRRGGPCGLPNVPGAGCQGC